MMGKIEGRREGDNRGWDGWMASPTRWTWVWATGSWWWTGRPGVLQSMGVTKSWILPSDWNDCSAELTDPYSGVLKRHNINKNMRMTTLKWYVMILKPHYVKKAILLWYFSCKKEEKIIQYTWIWEFPGSPVVRTLRFHCWGSGFDPWLGN